MTEPRTAMYLACQGDIQATLGCTLLTLHYHCVHDHLMPTQVVFPEYYTPEECEDLPEITDRDRAREAFYQTPAGKQHLLRGWYQIWEYTTSKQEVFTSMLALAEQLGLVMSVNRNDWAFVGSEMDTFSPSIISLEKQVQVIERIMAILRG